MKKTREESSNEFDVFEAEARARTSDVLDMSREYTGLIVRRVPGHVTPWTLPDRSSQSEARTSELQSFRALKL